MGTKLTRRAFNALLLSTGVAGSLPALSFAEPSPRFAHPGMLHSRGDLDRMRDAVQRRLQPIYAGFEKMRENPGSQLEYKSAGASAEIGRNPNVRFGEFDRDANAAYQCALMAYITGDHGFAKISIAILDDWASTLKKISGADAVLCASLGGFKLVNAAELIRHTDMGWPTESAGRFGRMMTGVFLPVIANFSPFANGNWDTAAIKLMISIAVYNDDRALFDRALEYYLNGCGDGRLEYYIYADGQCQESGRDQQHTQLGLTHQGDCCEIAWHQGLDLYGALDNRLLLGFEYTARYELGETVPFTPDVDQTGKYRHAVISPRSPLRPGYEQIYNHYVRRKGIAAPWTQKAAEQMRPEGAPFQADATGYGTLLYTRAVGADTSDAASLDAAPLLHATASENGTELSVLPLAAGARYTIVRAERREGPYKTIVRELAQGMYRDVTAAPEKLYFYRAGLSATRQLSTPVAQMATLPAGWTQQGIGQGRVEGHASYDGSAYTMSAGGAEAIDKGGGYFFLKHAFPVHSVLTARLQPLIASQFLSLGIAVRNAEGRELFLILTPRGGSAEHPDWTVSLMHRGGGGAVDPTAARVLTAPTVTYGRLVAPVWFRVRSTTGGIGAAISTDGATWSEIGSGGPLAGEIEAGLFLISGIDGVTTQVVFDQVSVGGLQVTIDGT